MALLIAFEGIDGAGKSTQAAELVRRLRAAQSEPVLLLHEPGGTPLGEQIEALIKRVDGLQICPEAELLLLTAARAELVTDVLRPSLAAGRIVVCDRYLYSTTAYQGWGRQLPLENVATANAIATRDLLPDLVILLDVPPQIGRARKGAATVADRIEAEDLSFQDRVRHGYLALATADAERWLVIDGNTPPDQVSEYIWRRIEPLL